MGEGESTEFGRDALGQALGAQDTVESIAQRGKGPPQPPAKPPGDGTRTGWEQEQDRAALRFAWHFSAGGQWRFRGLLEGFLVLLVLMGVGLGALLWDTIYGDDDEQGVATEAPAPRSHAGPGVLPEPGGSDSGSGGSSTGSAGSDVSGVYTIRLSSVRAIGGAECSQQSGTLTINQRGSSLTFKSGGDDGTGRINNDLTFTGTILGDGVTETMDGSFTVLEGGRITIHASDVLDLQSAACESTLDGERQGR